MNPSSANNTESYRLKILITVVLAFLILTYLHNVSKMFLVDKNFGDFANYYFYTQKMNEGIDIYRLRSQEVLALKQKSLIPVHITSGVGYPPFFKLIITPFTYLSFWSATLVWLLLNQLALVLCPLFAAFILRREERDGLIMFGILVATLFASQPLLENMGIGQSNVFILLALILICYFQYEGRQHLLSGALLAFVMIKPPFGALLFFFFLLDKNYKICLYAAAWFVAFHGIGTIAYGWQIEMSYWHVIINVTSFIAGRADVSNISLLGVFNRVFLGSPAKAYSFLFQAATSLGFFAYTFLRIFRSKERNFLVGYSSIMCLGILVTPLMEEHHLVMMYLPFVIAIYNLEIDKYTLFLLVTSFLLVSLRYSLNAFGYFHTGPLAVLTAGKISGVIIMWHLLLRGIAPAGAKALARPAAAS